MLIKTAALFKCILTAGSILTLTKQVQHPVAVMSCSPQKKLSVLHTTFFVFQKFYLFDYLIVINYVFYSSCNNLCSNTNYKKLSISFLRSLWTLKLRDVSTWPLRRSMTTWTLVFWVWTTSLIGRQWKSLWKMRMSHLFSSRQSTSGNFLKMQLWELWLAALVLETLTLSTIPSGNVNCLNQEEWHMPSDYQYDNDKVDTQAGMGWTSLDSFLHRVKNHFISNSVTGSVHPFLPLISGYPVHGHIYLILL